MSTARFSLPGESLGKKDGEMEAGRGVMEVNGEFYSTLCGQVIVEGGTISVVLPSGPSTSLSSSARDCAIIVGDTVHARVIKLMQNQVIVEVVAVNGTELRSPTKGAIRREDVRSTEIDQLHMQNCFRPGDLVVATVISLGDNRQIFLSTAEASKGVFIAKNRQTGNHLLPHSAHEMRDSVTGEAFPRKVASASS